MIKKSKKELTTLGWKGNVKARVHSANLDNKYREKNNDPVFRAQIETYKYYQNKVELLDETFRNSSFI
jgi:polyphosphate kinase